MHLSRALLHTSVALTLTVVPLGAALADTSGVSRGPDFRRNVSATPDLRSSKAKIDGFQFYVPARKAGGEPVAVEYRDAAGRLVETRDEARPLLSIYMDDAVDPADGDDVWAAYSLDDGDTWQRTNLSMVAARSSYEIDGDAYPGVVSKPVLTLKGNRAVAAWTSTYCDSGFPGYEELAEDAYDVGGPQRSVDYTLQGFPEVGEVPYKCLWAARARIDQATGAITWYQPERLTSGTRYAMQIAANSAPSTGFVLAWGEDPAGLAPGSGSGPGEGWTGAHPNPGTDVWYSFLPMSSFDAAVPSPTPHGDDPTELTERPRPAKTFTVPVPVSDNAPATGSDPAEVGATRPAVAVSATGTGAWVAYGYEETKEGMESELDPESGKRVIHHAFDIKSPDVASAGTTVSPAGQSARRVRYIAQPYGQMGDARTVGALIYRMGTDGHSGSADFMMHRFVVPATDAVLTDNPFRTDIMTGPTNVSATTARAVVADPVTGEQRTTRWIQTAANLGHAPGVSARESARGHRGFIKGDFLALGYLWTPNWKLFLEGRDIENYYVRRSFDGGRTFTTAPAADPYNGDGVRSCRYYNDPSSGARLAPVCRDIGPGEFEPAQNLSRLGGFDDSAIEPRLPGLPGTIPGSPYPEDTQDTSVVWQAWGTGLPKSTDSSDPEEGEPDVPVPDEGSGKGPLDVYYTFSQDYGDTYVRNTAIAKGPSAQAESQMRFSPDGSKMYVVWNDYGPGDLDVHFRRVTPDLFPYNTVEGGLGLTADLVDAREGGVARIAIARVGGRRGEVSVAYTTVDGTAVAGTHYVATSGRVTFGHGEVGPKTIVVRTVDNDADAWNGRFRVRLSSPSGGAWIDRARARVRILDDEDFTPPRSRADSPATTSMVAVPVRYTAVDRDSAIRKVVLFVRRPGSTGFSRAAVDRDVDGRFRYRTGGVNGAYAFYTVAVDAKGNREAAPASADSVTVLDTVRPRISSASVMPERFDISRDGTARVRFTLTERAAVRVVVRDGDGAVRSLPTRWSGPGVVVRRWDGTNDAGHLVRRGDYTVVIRATDAAANRAVRRLPLSVRR
ncbi:MAG TPA: choice-of-anchor O protein [Nocardioidaceae bacterium]